MCAVKNTDRCETDTLAGYVMEKVNILSVGTEHGFEDFGPQRVPASWNARHVGQSPSPGAGRADAVHQLLQGQGGGSLPAGEPRQVQSRRPWHR